MTVVQMTTLMMTSYLEVREDMERGLLLSRGSVPTGGLCCGRLENAHYDHHFYHNHSENMFIHHCHYDHT